MVAERGLARPGRSGFDTREMTGVPHRDPPSPPKRQLARGLLEFACALPAFAFAPVFRRRHMRWGATNAELAAAMRGDELVADATFVSTRALTIAAPPEAV